MTEASKLTRVDANPREYLGEGGGAAAAVADGVGDAEVQGNRKRHRLHEAEGLVPELDLGLEQGLALLAERHCIVLWVDDEASREENHISYLESSGPTIYISP